MNESSLRPELKERLIGAIQATGLDAYVDTIVASAREAIRIVATDDVDVLAVGESRIGGPPDLADESQWPRYGLGEHKDAFNVFYFQVNLADVPLVTGVTLPKQGVLSLFSTSQCQIDDEGAVVFTPDVGALRTQRLPDIREFGDEDLDEEHNVAVCFRKPKKLAFEVCISLPGDLFMPENIADDDVDNYLDLLDRIDGGTLQGQELGWMYSHPLQGMPEEDDASWMTLFNLHSGSPYFSFGDAGNCGVSVRRQQAAAGDFSEVRLGYCEG